MRLEKRELVGFAKIGQNAKAIEFREIRGRKLGLAQDLLFGKEGFSLKLLARFHDALRCAFTKVVDDHEGRDEGLVLLVDDEHLAVAAIEVEIREMVTTLAHLKRDEQGLEDVRFLVR